MDEAAAEDMTVRFVFDAEQGLSRIDKVKKGLMGIYEQTDKSITIFEKTIGFFWRLASALTKIMLLYKALPIVFKSIRTNFIRTDITMRQKFRLLGKDMSQMFFKVFEQGFWGGAKRQFFRNLREIASGKRKLTNIFSGVGKSLKGDISKNAPGVEKIATGLRGKFARIGEKVPAIKAFKEMGVLGGKVVGHVGKIALGPHGIKFLKVLGKAALIVGGIVLAFKALIGLYRKLIEVGLQAERSFTKMRIMLGSDKAAVQMMEKAEQFSLVTKYTPLEVSQAAAKVSGYKMDAFAKGKYGMEQDTNIMQIASGMAAISGYGLEHSVRALMRGEAALLDEYVAAREVYNKILSEGYKLGTLAFRKEFVKRVSMIPEYMRASKIESQTVAGLWSTISGATESMWTAMSGAGRDSEEIFNFWNQIQSILREWAEAAVEFANYVKPLMREIGATFGLLARTLWDVIVAIGSILKPVLKVVGAIVYGILFGIFRVINVILWTINKVLQGITYLFDLLWSKLYDLGVSLFGWLIDPIMTLYNWIADIFVQLAINIVMLKLYFSKGFVEVLKDLWNFILKIINKVGEVLNMLDVEFTSLISKGAKWVKDKVTGSVAKDKTHENVHDKYKSSVSTDKSVKNVSYDQSRTSVRKKTTNINVSVNSDSAINPYNMAGAQ